MVTLFRNCTASVISATCLEEVVRSGAQSRKVERKPGVGARPLWPHKRT
jgi:hypothetical protein